MKPISILYLEGLRYRAEKGDKFKAVDITNLINEINRLVAERTAMIEKINELIAIVS